jgi:hypothetical protein
MTNQVRRRMERQGGAEKGKQRFSTLPTPSPCVAIHYYCQRTRMSSPREGEGEQSTFLIFHARRADFAAAGVLSGRGDGGGGGRHIVARAYPPRDPIQSAFMDFYHLRHPGESNPKRFFPNEDLPAMFDLSAIYLRIYQSSRARSPSSRARQIVCSYSARSARLAHLPAPPPRPASHGKLFYLAKASSEV